MAINLWEQRRLKDGRRERDVRSEWERDYARLIHSSAFRRLQSKTQVLGLGESDFYRTRLTHSMEVSQIGVGIVRWLKQRYSDNQEIINALPGAALMGSICLAHDLGHPPFGHGGEIALNLCMRDCGGFEGNGQTLRILSRLDKYTDGFGMNPTRRMLLGILKYPAPYSQTVHSSFYGEVPVQRWLSKAKEQVPPKCYLDSESEVVAWILEALSDNEKRELIKVQIQPGAGGKQKHHKPIYKGLDTSIMELADDISYSLHDLEDAISLKMVNQGDWVAHNQDWQDKYGGLNLGYDFDQLTQRLFSGDSYERKKAIGDLVHSFITSSYVSNSALPDATTSLVKWNAYLGDSHKKLLRHIFELVRIKVIDSANVQQLEFKGQKLVIELFEALSSDPKRLLPASTLKRYDRVGSDAERLRVICDYISGMTDEYATRLYEKIYYPHKGSIFDQL